MMLYLEIHACALQQNGTDAAREEAEACGLLSSNKLPAFAVFLGQTAQATGQVEGGGYIPGDGELFLC